jgi:uncharacterized protein (TIGR03435 family)
MRHVIFFVVIASGLWAQPLQSPPDRPLRFDVASVKAVEGARIQVLPKRSGGRLTWPTNLLFLVSFAYDLPDWRIAGLPEWSEAYVIDATTAAQATTGEVQRMLQALLAERFGMAAHWTTREMDGYDLTVGKGGPKMAEAHDGDPQSPAPPMLGRFSAEDLKAVDGQLMFDVPEPGVTAIAGRRVGMARLARGLEKVLRLPVADRTGLAGQYYFACEFVRPGGPEDANAGSMREAMQSLGLRLEKRKTAAEVLVVDRIVKTPTEN